MSTAALEPDPVVEAFKKDVDRSLLRKHLQLTPTERIQLLIDLQEFAQEVRRAGRRAGLHNRD